MSSAYWLLLTLVAACSSRSGAPRQRDVGPLLVAIAPEVRLLGAAAGAHRLVADPSGRWIVAELGEWRRDAYPGDGAEVPPVAVRLELERGTREVLGNGWLAFGPDATGAVVLLEERNQEYEYWLARTVGADAAAERVPTPSGIWTRAATCSTKTRAVLVLADPRPSARSWWLAAVDPATLAVRGTATLGADTPPDEVRRVASVVCDGASDRVYVLVQTEAGWSVQAFDGEAMGAAWRADVCGGGARPCPDADAGLIAVTGDGARVAVVLGTGGRGGVLVASVVGLRSDGGAVDPALDVGSQLIADVTAIVPAGGSRLALLLRHLERAPSDSGFAGVVVTGADDGHLESLLAVAVAKVGRARFRMYREIDPLALAYVAGKVVVAPRFESTAIELDPRLRARWGRDLTASGRDAPSVRGAVTTPPGWHQADRPRVRAALGLPP